MVGTCTPWLPKARQRAISSATKTTKAMLHHWTPAVAPMTHATLIPTMIATRVCALDPSDRTRVRSTTSSAASGA